MTVLGNIPFTADISADNSVIYPGFVEASARSTAPTGWLLCDGSAVSRTTYATLFALIGTVFGSGDGTTTFNLPDVRGRIPIGQGGHADVDNVYDNEGLAVASRSPKHTHSNPNTGGPSSNTTADSTSQVNVASTSHGHGIGSTSSNGPSFLTINYYIKT